MPTRHVGTQALDKDIIAIRRQRVASLRARGLTHEEIYASLAHPETGLLNPDTQKPYDRTTITRDLKWLREDNHKQASADTSEHQARQFAELQEIKRAAWSQKSPQLALQALEKEMKLLGTMRQPDGINVNLLVVVQRFEAATKELAIDPAQALEEYIQALHAQRQTSG